MRRDRSPAQAWVVDVVAAYAREDSLDVASGPATDDAVQSAAGASLLKVVTHQLTEARAEVPPAAAAWSDGLGLAKLAQRADLVALAQCLDEASVRWVLLKGPVLDHVVYRVPGLRRYGDLDVLIHPEDFARGWARLQALAVDLDLNWARLAHTEQSEISMRLPHGTVLDLHWHVISNRTIRATFGLDVRLFFDELRWVEIEGRQMPTLSARDTALHVALHAALSGGHELRWMLDLHQTLTRTEPAALGRRATELHLGLVLEVMGDRMDAVLGSEDDWGVRLTLGQRIWARLCRLGGPLLPVSVGDTDRYSGRALFGSTRIDLPSSVRALTSATRDALRAGPARRSGEIDRRPLREPGGTAADLAHWLAVIEDAGRGVGSGDRSPQVEDARDQR